MGAGLAFAVPPPFVAPALPPAGRGIVRFSGHAALWDRPDRQDDVFRRGAFAGAVAVDLLRDHRGRAIGRVAVREDEIGLFVEGAAQGVRVGDGLSVGFRALATRQGARRELLRVVLVEVSLVRVPMQAGARVETISTV